MIGNKKSVFIYFHPVTNSAPLLHSNSKCLTEYENVYEKKRKKEGSL